jgi:hypothetical protein
VYASGKKHGALEEREEVITVAKARKAFLEAKRAKMKLMTDGRLAIFIISFPWGYERYELRA